MKKLILSTALGCVGFAAQADVTVMSWGGSYGAAQNEAHVKPFVEKTGIKAVMVDADDPAAPVKAMVEAGNVTVDVASLEVAQVVKLCDEGLLEPIDPAILPAAPDGTPAAEDFFEGGLNECGVATDMWANIYAYDSSKFPEGAGPSTIADFFDLQKFPGKRGVRKGPKSVLEISLMADGVKPEDVYSTLATPEGLDRAFAKLATIKDSIVWWEAGAQPPQFLADGEVVMSTAYNGRIFNAAQDEGKPFHIVWDGQVYEPELYAIPKGSPNLDEALEFIKFATSTEGLAAQAKQISYGPARKSSNATEILYKDGKTAMGPHLPTAPGNLTKALKSSQEFWADRDTELTERFNAWLASS
jgi:putative spermidine/putrescine transport system substrate-binding protein